MRHVARGTKAEVFFERGREMRGGKGILGRALGLFLLRSRSCEAFFSFF